MSGERSQYSDLQKADGKGNALLMRCLNSLPASRLHIINIGMKMNRRLVKIWTNFVSA
jgi:hypothetical protein